MPLPRIAARPGVVQAVLGVRRRVLDLADLLLPPEVALWDYVAGMQRTKLASALVGSGLADALNGERRDAAELARELDLDAEVTRRVLRAAAAARLVRIDGTGRARLTRTGAPLSSHHRHSIASWVGEVASARAARGYEALEAQLRGGAEPSGHRRAFGNSLWEYFDEHPDEGARFGNAMREMTALDVGALARGYPWPQRGVVCDVAGGIGTLLAAVLKTRSALDGILLEAPDVLAEAKGFLHSRGLSDRVERRRGDLFGELDARADVYILKWILPTGTTTPAATFSPGCAPPCLTDRKWSSSTSTTSPADRALSARLWTCTCWWNAREAASAQPPRSRRS